MKKTLFTLALSLALALLSSCGTVADREPAPETLTETASSRREETVFAPTTTAVTTSGTGVSTEAPRETETSAGTAKAATSLTTTTAAVTSRTYQGTAAGAEEAPTQYIQYEPPRTEARTAAETKPETTTTTSAVTTTVPPEDPAPQRRSLRYFSDYTDWAGEGYDQGTLIPQGAGGINEDRYRTLPGMEAYGSGRIVVGDSRCCQLGILQQVSGRSDFAAFAVWGGHLVPGVGYNILSRDNLEEIRACFEEQVRTAGGCEIYLFATVNDFDYSGGNNDGNIGAVVEAARALQALTVQGEEGPVSPRVRVIGFDGCWDTADLYGIPQESFNRYVVPFSDSLRARLAEAGFEDYTSVMDICGGKAGFIDDGLHYDEKTLEEITGHITGE